MPDQPARAGADLARAALVAARTAAKQRAASTTRKKPAGSAPRRGSGRDPISALEAVKQMLADRGYELPAAGGTVISQWPEIAPELAQQAAAEAFDADTGMLSLRPASAAYGTHLRLSERDIVGRINDRMGRPVVKSLRILSPRPGPSGCSGTGDTTGPQDHPQDRSRPTAAATAVRRPAPAAGYLDAKSTAHAATQPADPLAPAVRRAVDAQSAALRAGREREEEFADGVALREELAARAAATEDVRLRAIARKRLEQAGHTLPAAPAGPGALDRTA